MKICENYEVDMLKIIRIILGYTLNNFTNSCDNTIVDHGKFNKFQILKNEFIFLKKKQCSFCQRGN